MTIARFTHELVRLSGGIVFASVVQLPLGATASPVPQTTGTPAQAAAGAKSQDGIDVAAPKLLLLQVQRGATVRSLTSGEALRPSDPFAVTVRPLSPGSLWVLLQHGASEVQAIAHFEVPAPDPRGRFRPLRVPATPIGWLTLPAVQRGDLLCVVAVSPTADARNRTCRSQLRGRGDDPAPPPPPSPSGQDRGSSPPPPPVDGDGSRGPDESAVLLLPLAQ